MTNPKGKYNTWTKLTIAKPKKIDEIMFEENTDLDNLFFYADPKEIKKGKTLFSYKNIINFVAK